MLIAELWRYPVKSLAGERIDQAELTADGVPGDRLVHVRGPEGVRTSRRQFKMLGLHSTLRNDGRALVNGFDWESDEALQLVQAAAGDDAMLVEYRGVERFDVLPLLVATDGAIAEFGRDVRRLRPNIVISGVEGMAERTWEDRMLHVGDVSIYLDSLRSRCPMTTVDPDTIERDPEVLRDIGRRFGGKLALNASVVKGGVIRVGDEITLSD
ncbi:MAG: MOSC N-terminal beta barrel domain-containing protein [Gemmatimonadaceae bacterium]